MLFFGALYSALLVFGGGLERTPKQFILYLVAPAMIIFCLGIYHALKIPVPIKKERQNK